MGVGTHRHNNRRSATVSRSSRDMAYLIFIVVGKQVLGFIEQSGFSPSVLSFSRCKGVNRYKLYRSIKVKVCWTQVTGILYVMTGHP